MKLLLLLFSTFLIRSAFAAKFPCPKELGTKQSAVGSKKNWSNFQDSQNPNQLKTVEFYSGHPKQLAQLAPDNKDTQENPFWTFVPKDEIWQVCVYQDTRVKLIKKLGKGLKRCDVTLNKTTRPEIDSIECN